MGAYSQTHLTTCEERSPKCKLLYRDKIERDMPRAREHMNEMHRNQIPLLSKSRFMSGLQCHKRLYLECFHRDLSDPVDEWQQSIFDAGTNVGELARSLYPSGVLIDEDHFHHEDAMISTRAALTNLGLPAVFEAAFLCDDVRIRVDILARLGRDSFELIEVKSNTGLKDEHIPDVAVQLYVLTGCGISIRRACLAHLNKEYVYGGGDYDLNQLFCVEDITNEAREMQDDISLALAAMRLPLWDAEPPDVAARRQCTRPYQCQFYCHCHADEPEHHVSQLPGAREKLLRSLEEVGIEDIRDIPPGFSGLSAIQQRVRDCVVNERFHLDDELPRALRELAYPVHFLDFETFNPALPVYVETRPYQVIPFQWSDHILDRNGKLRHEEFLHEGSTDPREPFARSLLTALGAEGSIVVYSGFEAARIRELAAALPSLSTELLGLLESRIVDLLQLVRKHCYHPEFRGSFSIKSVLPALVPELDYSDLEIRDGGMASVAYAEMIQPETLPERRDFLRRSLLAYCKRDTEAEVRLFQTLQSSLPI